MDRGTDLKFYDQWENNEHIKAHESEDILNHILKYLYAYICIALTLYKCACVWFQLFSQWLLDMATTSDARMS